MLTQLRTRMYKSFRITLYYVIFRNVDCGKRETRFTILFGQEPIIAVNFIVTISPKIVVSSNVVSNVS